MPVPNSFTERGQLSLARGLRCIFSFSYSHLAGRFLSSLFGRFILRYLKVFWALSLIVLSVVVGVASWQTVQLATDWEFCNLADPVSDVTGIGIRLATYLQALLTIFVEFYSAKQAGVVLHMNLAFIWTLGILYWSSNVTLNVVYIILCLGNCVFLVTLSRVIFPIQDERDNQETLLTIFLRFATYILWGTCYIDFWYNAVVPNFSNIMVTVSLDGKSEDISQHDAQLLGICVQELRGWLFVPWRLERRLSNPVYLANSIVFGFCVGFFCLMSLRLFRMCWLVLCLAWNSSTVDIPTGGPGTEVDGSISKHLTQCTLRSMSHARMPSRCRILLDSWCWFPSGELKFITSSVSFFRTHT